MGDIDPQDVVFEWRCAFCGREHRWIERVDLTMRYREPLVCPAPDCGWRAATAPALVIGPDEQ